MPVILDSYHELAPVAAIRDGFDGGLDLDGIGEVGAGSAAGVESPAPPAWLALVTIGSGAFGGYRLAEAIREDMQAQPWQRVVLSALAVAGGALAGYSGGNLAYRALARRRALEGLGGLGGDLGELDGFFSKLAKGIKRAVTPPRSIRKALKKLSLKGAMKTLNKLAPVASLIPGAGPAIGMAVKTANRFYGRARQVHNKLKNVRNMVVHGAKALSQGQIPPFVSQMMGQQAQQRQARMPQMQPRQAFPRPQARRQAPQVPPRQWYRPPQVPPRYTYRQPPQAYPYPYPQPQPRPQPRYRPQYQYRQPYAWGSPQPWG